MISVTLIVKSDKKKLLLTKKAYNQLVEALHNAKYSSKIGIEMSNGKKFVFVRKDVLPIIIMES